MEPWWPLAALAMIQLGDAVISYEPVRFVRQCLLDVGFPARFWKTLPVVKVAAAAGLIGGIWISPLAVVTCAALVCYFLVAITMHVRARDFGRNLFVNATGMLVLCVATLVVVVAAS
jgi:hypothetical protein